jgi:hypothetical protein
MVPYWRSSLDFLEIGPWTAGRSALRFLEYPTEQAFKKVWVVCPGRSRAKRSTSMIYPLVR